MSESRNRPNRSAADFESADDLRRALKSMSVKQSPSDGQYISFAHPAMQETQIGSASTQIDESIHTVGTAPLDPELDWVLDLYDTETTEAQSLREELKRLLVLKSYLLLDSERQESFERITGLASRIFKCPIALISLVDLGRQWFMSNRGLGDMRESDRKTAFCAHAIMGKEDIMIVPDATKDWRFQENPLVTGDPCIRFYAGAPLVSPEGYKLGTLCVLDIAPRPQGLSLEEKLNLTELASLAVEAAVDHKQEKAQDFNDPAKLIAYTAHDLLTPLTGVQLSLYQLSEDADFISKLTQQQKEMISIASNCNAVMGRICQTAISSFRKSQTKESLKTQEESEPTGESILKAAVPTYIPDFVKSLYMVLEPYPKSVPLIITVHPSVPEAIVIDDLKVFRSLVNFLTNACANTKKGSVHLSITTVTENGGTKLLFECVDTGPGIPVEKYPHLFRPFTYDPEDDEHDMSCVKPSPNGGVDSVTRVQMPNSGLGLYSVAVHISSIGGDYGFRPREATEGDDSNGQPVTGSIFWFQVPLALPDSSVDHQVAILKASHDLRASIRELSKEFSPRKNIKVLRTPTISDADANKIYNSFTRILEGGVLDGIDQAAEAAKAAIIATGESKVAKEAAESNMKEAVPMNEGEQRKRKALVIEDSMVVRKSLTRVLTKLGFEAVQAVDGMEGLKELQCALFDVVLCDFLMPVMDGLDCVQQYREWEKVHRPFFKQYIIGISAHAGEQDIAKGTEVGMDDFRPKPVTYKQLAELSEGDALKVYSDQLDEIGATGTMMVNAAAPAKGEAETKGGHSNSNVSEKSQDHKYSNSSPHFCLIAVEKRTLEVEAVERAAQDKGWKSVTVNNGEDALKLMKLRNWDAILLDEDLPIVASTQCVSRFREWEERNRVNRQRNIVLLSASCVSMVVGLKSMVQLPFGFDCALGKPIHTNEFEFIMTQAERCETDLDIVAR
jgi:CheY-like chemotaxis protein/GAF domain-containing protein